jgi:hypothetical protein
MERAHFGEHLRARGAHVAQEIGSRLDVVEIDDQPGEPALNERTERA